MYNALVFSVLTQNKRHAISVRRMIFENIMQFNNMLTNYDRLGL